MIILPAIDIKDGQCVRLQKGDFSTTHKVAEDPIKTALGFKAAGAKWIHIVDLDGAKDGVRTNSALILEIVRASGLLCEVGGGIRSMEDVRFYLENGVQRVILGSAAVKNPDFVREAVEKYGDQIAVGIDAKDDIVAAEGWIESCSGVNYIEFAKMMDKIGVKTIIFTDISKDGMLCGPAIDKLIKLNSAVSCDIIASGGISCIDDIIACKDANLYGTICGKSIYTGALNLAEAVAEAADLSKYFKKGE
ncbi:MAG: 1-(5-phosphoribosyl)-5-[Clostridia bacterium]|nr:1-(5-phosphoribosyl)-5-[(5-phosphoribosylamino)methylideneamino]imidazole-4-carboxamide isomerase [Clostridia bacterium]